MLRIGEAIHLASIFLFLFFLHAIAAFNSSVVTGLQTAAGCQKRYNSLLLLRSKQASYKQKQRRQKYKKNKIKLQKRKIEAQQNILRSENGCLTSL